MKDESGMCRTCRAKKAQPLRAKEKKERPWYLRTDTVGRK